MTHTEGANSGAAGNQSTPMLNPEGERVGIVIDPITQEKKSSAPREGYKQHESEEASPTQPSLKEMQKELEEHVRRERELKKLMKMAIAGKNVKETTQDVEEEVEDEPMTMTQEAIARYLEANYRIVKQENYNFMASPYSSEIIEYHYPEDYTSQKFKVYNGQGNAREHLSRFLSTMNDRAADGKLCLREFPKSLTDMEFTWYDNIKPGSVHSWSAISTLFLRKFYSAKRKVTTIDLSK
ncbi:uncharacterized protein LOC113305652 [Papaver somniferum]|uniref:uncharacterized protein LOC113305652 n=1 Tax=Papaver somniferum TaxID=3469 RepID=UPI000E6FCEFC|nr:uncharacterized protein LOC113305652 [Papaver somniferum]